MNFSQRMCARPAFSLCFAALLSGCAPHGSGSEDSGTELGAAQSSRHDASDDDGSESASDAAVSDPGANDGAVSDPGPSDASSGRDAGGPTGPKEDAGGLRDAGASASKDAGLATKDAGPTRLSCDRRPLTCRRAEPLCAEGQVAAIVGNCFGECVRIDACACSEAAACPQPERYTCHMSAMHCGPYVN